MKKYFATFLSALMALSLAACGTDTSAGIGPIVGKGDASDNRVESGATVDGGVLTANTIGY